ncbi:Platinum sensitivity protein [Linnemannia schmuckeri]|uniref:Platinum sensitivity protein n=1 Tax=Linnemannia schmuckeri TaxID=64567 RepID=A0A9P5VAB0_9FUNG|nr:Platinum sensitivity protein [Linnemannia schmuckeri]
MDSATKMRVKVYRLSAGSQWIDQGTGHCSCEFNMDKSEGTLIVHSEDSDDKVLLSSRIRVGEDLYQRQQETLIVWSEDEGVDLALSFQEAEGCGEIWDNINEVQQHYAEDLFSDPSDVNGTGSGEYITLPDPDISNLAEIEHLIKEAQSGANEKERLAAFIIMDSYIDKLFPILETCEDLDNYADLHILHDIMLGIIMLNDIAIIQHILKDEIILNCVAMLQYDSELGESKEEYREFLSRRSKYKQIVPINDPEVEQKIHQVFRLQYLRDTVLAQYMDESLSSILGSLIFFHNIDIVNYIHGDRAFLRDLFGILEDDSETIDRKRDVILFTQQFCSIAKATQLPTRVGLYRTLSQTGLFHVFEVALGDSLPKIRMAGTEVFLAAMEHDPNLIRSYIVRQSEDKPPKQLMDIILNQFLVEEDVGIRLQFSEVIRSLLDINAAQTETGMPLALDVPTNSDPDADKYLELFYMPYIAKFVSPLLELTEEKTQFDRTFASLCESICQILSFMVRHHTFRSKYYVLSSGIVAKMCLLMKNRDMHIRLCALRFFRTCVGLNDDFYHRYLIKHNVVQHIMDMLLATGNKNNLVNSACIEFFDFIRSENIKSLINHIVPLYRDQIKDIEYVATFKGLIRRYEQQHDTSIADAEAAEVAASETSSAKRGQEHNAWSSSTVDDDEEAYFNNSDDELEVPDGGKQEDDPPTSDLRRRVVAGSDSDSDSEEQGITAMDAEPVLASQASLLLPLTPPTRRKLVPYGEDDDDEDEGVFNRHDRDLEKKANGSESSTELSSEPPLKKAKLDNDSDSDDQHDQTMTDAAEDASKAKAGSGSGIKFKLNSVRNGRSPSPLSSPNARSRSVSPLASTSVLPPVATRTGIKFVLAGSNDGSGEATGGDAKEGVGKDGRETVTEAAIHLRSDMARDYKRSDDEEGETAKPQQDASTASPIEPQLPLTEQATETEKQEQAGPDSAESSVEQEQEEEDTGVVVNESDAE